MMQTSQQQQAGNSLTFVGEGVVREYGGGEEGEGVK